MKLIPEIGDLFTVSGSKTTSDRSYMEAVWRCIARNEAYIQAEYVHSGWRDPGKPVMFHVDERDFQDASMIKNPNNL